MPSARSKNSRGSRAGNSRRRGPTAGQHSRDGYRAQAEGVIRFHGRQARRQHRQRHLATLRTGNRESICSGDAASESRRSGNVADAVLIALRHDEFVRRSRRVLGAAAAAIRMAGPGNPRPSARHRGDALIMIRVKLEENGRTRTVTAQEVIVRNLVNAAARRDLERRQPARP